MRALSPHLKDLYSRAPRGIELGLAPTAAACEALGHPERSAKLTAHVAGTNGKGSVSAMLESIARAAGHHTGLYTSPHLCRFAERIRIDGEPLSDERLEAVLGEALGLTPKLTFFEAATVAAFLAFREERVTTQVIEVGLGGRLDATNVLSAPTVSVITRIDFDHEERLGHTLAAIAGEKAGIAKAASPIVVGALDEDSKRVITEKAAQAGTTVIHALEDEEACALAKRAHLLLAGAHQLGNATIAAAAARVMGFSADAVERGLSTATWPGRLETIESGGRFFLLDAAHNPDGARSLAFHVGSAARDGSKATGTGGADLLVFGALLDKSWKKMLEILAPIAPNRIYAIPPGARPRRSPSSRKSRRVKPRSP